MRLPGTFARVALAILALFAASCGEADDRPLRTDIVDEVLAAAELPAESVTTTTLPEGCRIVTEVDEYGFTVETTVCDGATAEPEPAETSWLGSADAEDVATRLQAALIDQYSCGRPVAFGRLRSLVAEAEDRISSPLFAAIAALERGSLYCNEDKDAWAKAMEEAVAHLDDFLEAAEEAAAEEAAAGSQEQQRPPAVEGS